MQILHKSSKLTTPVLSIFCIGTLLFTSTIFSSFNISSSQQVFAQPMSPYEYETNNIVMMIMITIMFLVLTANIQQKKINMNVEQVHLKAFL